MKLLSACIIIFFLIVAVLTNIYSAQNKGYLKNYSFEKNRAVQFSLNQKLDEISGLAFNNSKLFAHNDEKGTIFEIDNITAQIKKSFFLGRWTVIADFEGIAFADSFFYLITSDGVLYKFKEGKEGEAVDYEIIKTGLSSKFEIEGLCFDPETNSLLFACKDYPGKGYKGYRAVYSFSLKDFKTSRKPRFLISLKDLKREYNIKNFFPSGIERHPSGDSFFIISAKDDAAIVEISKKGEILHAVDIKNSLYKQPEGITFDQDGVLIIADEANARKPTLTKYFPKKYLKGDG